MGMGFAPTWLRQVSPPASHDHFNHWRYGLVCACWWYAACRAYFSVWLGLLATVLILTALVG